MVLRSISYKVWNFIIPGPGRNGWCSSESPISTIASGNGGPEMRLTMRIQGNHTLPVTADSYDLVSDTEWNKEEALTYR
jgi:hypothetical protein